MLDEIRLFRRLPLQAPAHHLKRIWSSLAAGGVAALLAYAAFLLHLNLSSAGSLELLLVILVALRWGFPEATAASLIAVTGLNLLFIPPLFRLTVADPANWVSLATFEGTALLVSRLSAKVKLSAVDAENQRRRVTKLYELSRAILLIDSRASIKEQLSTLIRDIIQVEDVHLSFSPKRHHASQEQSSALHDAGRVASRTLRTATAVIGTLTLSGGEEDPMLADAVASLAAIAVERARAVQEESRAESERDIERLRTAVLDSLAHGFKTPLTAIQTASSGLLAIGDTNATQTELLSIIDEQATLLSRLTTKLLQTASLEHRQIRLKKTEQSMPALVEDVIASLDPATQQRIRLLAAQECGPCVVDAELVTLALNQLLDNAVKYSTDGELIEVSVQQQSCLVIVSFQNYGVPILAEEAYKIFDRFYRGVHALRGPAGTGLGLSIVRKVALAHGGDVSVQLDGNRTKFTFTVPR